MTNISDAFVRFQTLDLFPRTWAQLRKQFFGFITTEVGIEPDHNTHHHIPTSYVCVTSIVPDELTDSESFSKAIISGLENQHLQQIDRF